MSNEEAATPLGAAAGNVLGNDVSSLADDKSQVIGHFSNIPDELKLLRQWVNWKFVYTMGEKPRKVPINPLDGTSAASDNPSTWAGYDEAVDAFRCHNCDGIGFVLTKDDPYGFIDLDDA